MTAIDQPLTRADVYYTVCPVPAASSLAIARGDFDRSFAGSGVDLVNIRSHADRSVREAHYTQRHDNLFREGGNIPPIWARSDGRRLRVIGLTWVEHFSAIVARPGSGIETAADLAGKRLGLLKRPHDPVDYPRATALRGFVSALSSAGLQPDDVELVDVVHEQPLVARVPDDAALSRSRFSAREVRRRQGVEIAALLSGHVDALHLTSNDLEIAELVGGHVVADVGSLPERRDRVNNLTPIVFTVREELLEERPDVVDRYLAEAIRTARWAASSAEESKRLIARDTSIPEELVDAAFSPDVHRSLEPTTDPELVELLVEQKDFLLRWGFLEGDFDARAWVDPDPLARARELVDG